LIVEKRGLRVRIGRPIGAHMRIFNVHERRVGSPVESAGKLLDGLAGSDDRLWPHEKWPAMKLDSPLGKGARGGHGPVRYTVQDFIPGRRVDFVFDNHGIAAGFRGKHYFEVQPLGDGALLRHVIEAQSGFGTWLRWAVMIRPLHDALIEDAFDKAEHGLAGTARREDQARWSQWVKILRWVIAKTGG